MKRRKYRRGEQTMAATVAVKEASEWARTLIQRETRGFGDHDNAIRRLCHRHDGLTPSLLSNLLYRPPKDLMVSKYIALQTAFINECDRHERAIRHEREIAATKSLAAKAFVGVGSALSSAADAADGAAVLLDREED